MIDEKEELKEVVDGTAEINEDLETVESGVTDNDGDDNAAVLDGASDDEAEAKGAETVVSFGDDADEEEEGQDDTKWIKDLRQRNRDQNKEISALKKEREQYIQPVTALGERPTLEGADYDAEVYEGQLTNWLGQKSVIEQEQWQIQQQHDEQGRAWERRRGEYIDGQKAFEAAEYEEAEGAVQAVMNDEQQYLMVHIAGKQAASMVMGLARNTRQMQELAAIKNRELFSAAVGRLEAKMKVSRTKPKTQVEKRINAGGGGVSGNSHLEELREKATKTGDYTEILKYKRQLKEKAA